MSLLKPTKAKTHKSMDMQAIIRMAGEVEDLAQDGQVSADAIRDLAEDLGVPAAKLYAGLGMTPALALKLEHDIQLVVCTGGCQDYGALPCVTRMLEIREDRTDDDKKAFDVIPRHCLNHCQSAPVVEVRSPDGNALLTEATPESIEQALAELLDA